MMQKSEHVSLAATAHEVRCLADRPTVPPDIYLPESCVWLVVLAAGITLVLFGVVTSLSLSALGAVFLVWSLVGWFRELLNAPDS